MNYDQRTNKHIGNPVSIHEPTAASGRALQGPSSAIYRPLTPAENDIPLLDDIVSEPATIQPALGRANHPEPSADDQLARTNKYKTLTESDLERAEAANDTSVSVAGAQATTNQISMLMLDECLIDDDLDINFDEDTSFEESLQRLEQDLEESPVIQQYQTILPDLDRLNSELGVDPLPLSPTAPEPANQLHPPLRDASSNTLETGESADPAPGTTTIDHSTSIQIPSFTLYASTFIDAPCDKLRAEPAGSRPPVEFPSEASLGLAIDAALAQALPTLKQAVLQQLAPWLCSDSVEKP
jgi:hypothetical protein